MNISFIGDLCLGRHIREAFEEHPIQFVSKDLIDCLKESDGRVIANLESPVSDVYQNQDRQFCGIPEMLKQFRWVDCFSLANNHINDFGEDAIRSTIGSLDELGISYNGIYEGTYKPFIIEENDCKIAVFCSATKVGEPFKDNCQLRLLYNADDILYDYIKEYKQQGYLVIVFAHIGSMFCRYPNINVIDTAKKMIGAGCDCVVTSHPHCVGSFFNYNGYPVFYSLGDFLMDGSSFRRRQSIVIKLDIRDNKVAKWDIIPTVTTTDFKVELPDKRVEKRILKSFSSVSKKIAKKKKNYEGFYRFHYKFELINHSLSTLHYVYHTKGVSGVFRDIFGRTEDFKGVVFRFKKGSSSDMLKEETRNGHLDIHNFGKQ